MNDNEKIERLKDIKIENNVWLIYIGIIFLSFYANSKEKNIFYTMMTLPKKEYQNIMILIFTILVITYYHFTKDSYEDLENLNKNDSEKKKNLTFLSFICSLLVLLSGLIILTIVAVDDNIDTEIAFN